MTRAVTVPVQDPTRRVQAQVSQAVLRIAQQNLYELAKADGFTGTLQDFIDTLKPQWASTNW